MYWTRLGTILNAEIKLGGESAKILTRSRTRTTSDWLGDDCWSRKASKLSAIISEERQKHGKRATKITSERGYCFYGGCCSELLPVLLLFWFLFALAFSPLAAPMADFCNFMFPRRHQQQQPQPQREVVVLGILCRLNLWPEKLISAKWSTRDDHHYNRTFHSAGMVNPTC